MTMHLLKGDEKSQEKKYLKKTFQENDKEKDKWTLQIKFLVETFATLSKELEGGGRRQRRESYDECWQGSLGRKSPKKSPRCCFAPIRTLHRQGAASPPANAV